MPRIPGSPVDPHLIIDAASQVMDALEGCPMDIAFAGTALASFMLYREDRLVEQNMNLLEEYTLWLHAQMADLEEN